MVCVVPGKNPSARSEGETGWIAELYHGVYMRPGIVHLSYNGGGNVVEDVLCGPEQQGETLFVPTNSAHFTQNKKRWHGEAPEPWYRDLEHGQYGGRV